MPHNRKQLQSLKDNIHIILHGTREQKEKFQRTFFYIADTPDFMKKLGLTGDYFSVKYGVISRHLGKDADHNLKEKDWLDLCIKITAPFAIAQYGEGYRLFVNIKVDGIFTVVGVKVNFPEKGLEVNSVMTAFGYRGSPDQEQFIYINKKLTPEQAALLEGLNSLQYPHDRGPDRRA